MKNRDSLKGFWHLIATQFQGAFSDNAYKNIVTLLAVSTAVTPREESERISLAGALFILPFLLFSMYGGFLADRFSKRSVTIWTKVAEVAIMLLATVELSLGNLSLALGLLFLTGSQAAIFGPSKYGILPELLPEKRLSWGNGILEMTTFLSIILGTVAGAILVEHLRGHLYWAGLILVGLALMGTATSLGIDRLPAANAAARFRWNFVADLWQHLQQARKDRILWLAVVGSSYFWFLGFLFQTNIVLYGKNFLGLPEGRVGYLLAAVALGIGLGSYVAGYLSGDKIEYGLIPLGSIAITLFSSLLGLLLWDFWHSAGLLALIGFSSGFFIVPLNALIQQRPHPSIKGAMIAMSNLMTFVGMLLAAGLFWVLTASLQMSPHHVFLAGALMTLAATIYVWILLPDSLLRLLLWFLTHSLYRIRVVGRDNIPEKGGALFVSNHMSFVDALLLIASTDRFIRFLMEKDIYERPFIKPFAKIMHAIPISGQRGPRALIFALREASRSIQAGDVVCIFAEGQITRTGQLLPFRKGFERIMKNVDAPIIPINLDRVWGSVFSFHKGRFFWKVPSRIPYPVTVTYGAPLPGQSPAQVVRQKVQELSTEAFVFRKADQTQLQRAFVLQVHRHPWRFAVADGMTPKVNYLGLLSRSIFLARLLAIHWRGQKMVGLLLPPSVAGVAANIAALLAGKIPVNLNYTVSQSVLESCISQCQITTVITSRQFLERVKLQPPLGAVFLEDLAQQKTFGRTLAALLAALFLPSNLLQRLLGSRRLRGVDELATIIFSSGSTGDPKGVMLSHHNISSNLDGMAQVFATSGQDCILGVLPFFHSFGFTGTLWFPLIKGMGAVYHPNPLDARTIGALASRYRATILLATPTFLQSYIRRCNPEDFGSLQFVMVGAEKLTDRVAMAFEEKFGIRPMEGYGCTECAPIVSVNVRDFRAAGFYQVGQKRGRIGHPLPGISVRIVDPETWQPLPAGSVGLLLVKGPNVMLGYLNRPDKTAEVIRDGSYVTGDLAMLDVDGFLTIIDRLSRFSKIGGEMVPHVKVEESLNQLVDGADLAFAVTGVPDEKKGERLVVLHTLAEEKLKEIQSRLATSGLPNLWIPRTGAYFQVEKIPLLGTGKMDLRSIRELALRQSEAQSRSRPTKVTD
jgi:acyl-[acyl-carrier-protein]-phospholipid O-acyltransferase / long-chain-fatty-acid--[acyl-carrier-protein] ligase